MIIERSFDQGSDEWHKALIGNLGATGLKKIITSKGVPSKSREKYLWELAEEHISGKKIPLYPTYWMKRGLELEPEARHVFVWSTGIEIEEVAMIYSDNKTHHVSPDGINEKEQVGLEIKCLSLAVFDAYREANKLPTEFILQLQMSLAVSCFDYWYFFLYYPGLEPMTLKIERDESLIKIIKAEINIFIRDLNNLIERLKK